MMDLSEMREHLESIARSENVPPSARVRATRYCCGSQSNRRPRTPNGIGSSPSSGAPVLSPTAERRLLHYCRRAVFSPRESVERPYGLGKRRLVRYLNRQLRELVWADKEVRDELLEENFDSLAALVNRDGASALALLDLVSGVSLERELREPQAA
jgi:hypothetical protein